MKRNFTIILAILVGCLCAEARTVKGKVVSGKKKLAGVVVTDGKNFTQTKKNGSFEFDIDDEAEFVYVVTPSGYVADWSKGAPEFYIKAEGKESFNFNLKEFEDYSGSYSIIAVGDPQPIKHSQFDEFANKPLEDIRKCAASLGRPTIGIALGDICFDQMVLLERWKREIGRAGIPFYAVIGNHDHDKTIDNDTYSSMKYRELFGPENYAFMMGNDVVIVLDNIIFRSKNRYRTGYTDAILDWVEGLMTYIPEDAEVFIAHHSPLNGTYHRGMILGHERLLSILKGHKVTLMSGHNHTNRNFEYAPDVFEHNVAAICGTWWSAYLCTDGTPRGFKVFTKENGELTWYYKSVDKDKDYQYEIFNIGQATLNPDSIVVNVWDYDPKWSIEWYEDGKYMGAMTQVEEYSPTHTAEIKARYEGTGRPIPKYRMTTKSTNYFAAKPSAEAKKVEIRIKSRFGKEWVEEIEL